MEIYSIFLRAVLRQSIEVKLIRSVHRFRFCFGKQSVEILSIFSKKNCFSRIIQKSIKQQAVLPTKIFLISTKNCLVASFLPYYTSPPPRRSKKKKFWIFGLISKNKRSLQHIWLMGSQTNFLHNFFKLMGCKSSSLERFPPKLFREEICIRLQELKK